MIETLPLPKQALKYEANVTAQGQVTLTVPFSPGVRVTVFVLEESVDDFLDLTNAAQSSLDFWDNPLDDEDWNDA